MAAKFVIATGPGALAVQKNALTAFLQGKGFQVWHWFDDLWLVADTPPETTARGLAEELEKVVGLPLNNHLVIKLDGDSPYWGRSQDESWAWMREHWGPAGRE